MSDLILLDPTTKSTLNLKLYRNVKNVPELRQKVMRGDLKCCLVKPSLILDPFQIVIAANKTVRTEKFKTKSLYTEILFNLSVSKNITQSLQLFGVRDEDTDVIIVLIAAGDTADKSNVVFEEVQGDEVDCASLNGLCNREALRKAYKISDVEFRELNLLDSIVSRIAVKDCML